MFVSPGSLHEIYQCEILPAPSIPALQQPLEPHLQPPPQQMPSCPAGHPAAHPALLRPLSNLHPAPSAINPAPNIHNPSPLHTTSNQSSSPYLSEHQCDSASFSTHSATTNKLPAALVTQHLAPAPSGGSAWTSPAPFSSTASPRPWWTAVLPGLSRSKWFAQENCWLRRHKIKRYIFQALERSNMIVINDNGI